MSETKYNLTRCSDPKFKKLIDSMPDTPWHTWQGECPQCVIEALLKENERLRQQLEIAKELLKEFFQKKNTELDIQDE